MPTGDTINMSWCVDQVLPGCASSAEGSPLVLAPRTAHFIGTITSAFDFGASAVSVQWQIIPGKKTWTKSHGAHHGETPAVTCEPTDAAEIQHQFDVCYETSSIEGWPLLVVEVWDRMQAGGEKRFCGCGAVTLPTSPGRHVMDCVTWRPLDTWWSMITDYLLSYTWEYKRSQVLTALLQPNERPSIRTTTAGIVRVEVHTITAGFEEGGAALHGSQAD